MKVDKGSCGNPDCDRPIDRTFQRLNQTQTYYCSLYCNRYTTEGLNKCLASDSKYHKNIYKFPIIESHCENCGDVVELKWQHNKSNKHANAVAKVINDKQSVYTVSGRAIGNHMKYLAAKGLVQVQDNRSRPNEYRFNTMYRQQPLIPLLTQTLK